MYAGLFQYTVLGDYGLGNSQLETYWDLSVGNVLEIILC